MVLFLPLFNESVSRVRSTKSRLPFNSFRYTRQEMLRTRRCVGVVAQWWYSNQQWSGTGISHLDWIGSPQVDTSLGIAELCWGELIYWARNTSKFAINSSYLPIQKTQIWIFHWMEEQVHPSVYFTDDDPKIRVIVSSSSQKQQRKKKESELANNHVEMGSLC